MAISAAALCLSKTGPDSGPGSRGKAEQEPEAKRMRCAARLWNAVWDRSLDAFCRAVEAGADVNQVVEGRSPLEQAVEQGSFEIAQMLYRSGAVPDVSDRTAGRRHAPPEG